METTSFECAKCGRRMGVSSDYLGREVQCPHCHQIVVAPPPGIGAAATAPPPELVFSVPSAEEIEDIFAPPGQGGGDDLFGFPPPAPSVEMPPADAPPVATPELLSPGQPRPATPPVDRAVTFIADDRGPAAHSPLSVPTLVAADPVMLPPAPENEAAAEALPSAPTLTRRRPERSTLGPMVLIFLIPYAVTTTLVICWLIYNQSKAPLFDPLERLPDPKPASGGARRIHPKSPLPAKLKTSLNQSLRVGDLEVTPLHVALDGQGRLALSLKLCNVSEDVAFNPVLANESYRPPSGMLDTGPYTYLSVRDQPLYVLGAEWYKTPPRKAGEPFDGTLQPGEAMIAIFRTRSDDKGILKKAEAVAGGLLWRVQLRRGLVAVNGDEVSATAVIGVEFGARAIAHEQGAMAGRSELLAARRLSSLEN